MSPIRLQLVCDHQMLADVLTARLAREPGTFVVHQRRSVDTDLTDALRAHRPCVVLVDARSVVGPWPAVVDELVEAAPRARVVVLSGTRDAEDAVAAARRCLAAWLPPDVTADEVIEVLHEVAAGHTVFPSSVLGTVFHRLTDGSGDSLATTGPLATLTGRERAVLACLVEGRRDGEIAEQLEMAPNTVRTHTGRILRKLGVHSRLEAVRVARNHDASLATPRLRTGSELTPPHGTRSPGPVALLRNGRRHRQSEYRA